MIHALSVALAVQAAGGLTPGPADLYVRVVDVGPGLCTITEIPNGHYLIYDAGHWQRLHCSMNRFPREGHMLRILLAGTPMRVSWPGQASLLVVWRTQ